MHSQGEEHGRAVRSGFAGLVLREHGGNAPQTKAAGEARIITMEAELEAAKEGEPYFLPGAPCTTQRNRQTSSESSGNPNYLSGPGREIRADPEIFWIPGDCSWVSVCCRHGGGNCGAYGVHPMTKDWPPPVRRVHARSVGPGKCQGHAGSSRPGGTDADGAIVSGDNVVNDGKPEARAAGVSGSGVV